MILPLFQSMTRRLHSFGHYSFESAVKAENYFLTYGKWKKKSAMSDDILCLLKLYNEETMYPVNQRSTLKKMLSYAKDYSTTGKFTEMKASGEPEILVFARRKGADLDRSDLQKICNDIASEFEIE